MSQSKRLFLGSSTEALEFVEEMLTALQKSPAKKRVKIVPWNTPGVFPPSQFTLETLLTAVPSYDGAVFVLTEKDEQWLGRGRTHNPRENIYFEIGLAMGQLGRDNVLLLQSEQTKVASDLEGLTTIRIPEDPDDADALRVVAEIGSHYARVPPSHVPARGKLIEMAESSSDFYERFESYLQHSKQFVFIIGSGFDISDEPSRRAAERYLRVLVGCAHRHPVIRIETALPRMQEWIKLVALYLADLRNVEVYVPEKKSFIARDICLIDPETDEAVVELMFPEERREAGKKAERFGVGLFLQSKRGSKTLNKKLTDYLEIGSVRRVQSEGLLQAYGIDDSILRGSSKPVRYFAYGSNMDKQQILDRMPSARFVGIARLAGYRIVFGTPGTVFRDSVGTITPDSGSEVWGGVFEATEYDIGRMDFYEGVGSGEYTRLSVEVELISGAVEEALTYHSAGSVQEGLASPEYLERLIRGALELGAPQIYIDWLKSLPHSET